MFKHSHNPNVLNFSKQKKVGGNKKELKTASKNALKTPTYTQ